ncbi:flagellar biosynthetic protein FlhB [Oxobacter pfennigii]|uniref:Flagellar biosynthetic protein FlhB n=1 Tax=Oxobacter pfennigii TaxID=36849 RepID=A0A0N8NTH3_9CLOT|nr:EscU/YscU/HrcU family type III secretion system export apparatus switch protein [Oxobacter pfennigii]KPU44832.1 flagellar biosynthetic protein FlhB [Oxobacter pfennigii]
MRKLKTAAALKYQPGNDMIPTVVASGRGYVAEKIMEIAREYNIPSVKDEHTSEILCSLPLNSEIPEHLYHVIAEIYANILYVSKK